MKRKQFSNCILEEQLVIPMNGRAWCLPRLLIFPIFARKNYGIKRLS